MHQQPVLKSFLFGITADDCLRVQSYLGPEGYKVTTDNSLDHLSSKEMGKRLADGF